MNHTVIYSDRKTVGIQVKRDGSVVVHAPRGMSRAEIERFVNSHSGWIEKKRAEKPERTGLDFVYYLGKKFELCEADGNKVGFGLAVLVQFQVAVATIICRVKRKTSRGELI